MIFIVSISDQQPDGRYCNLRSSDQCIIFLWDTSNNKKARESDVDCIRAASVPFCPLLYELFAIFSPIFLIISKLETAIWVGMYCRKQAAGQQSGSDPNQARVLSATIILPLVPEVER